MQIDRIFGNHNLPAKIHNISVTSYLLLRYHVLNIEVTNYRCSFQEYSIFINNVRI